MANLTTQQIAELLIGIARTQQAIVDGVESLKAGYKSGHLGPALDYAAKSRVTTRPMTLQEIPARVLLQCMGRAGPNLEQITRDLEALFSGQPVATAPAAAPATPAAAPAPAAPAADASSLDMTS